MERIFILAIILCLPGWNSGLFSQNLLLNGDFEEINRPNGHYKYYLDTFYAKSWFEPTDGSVDIYRDFRACDDRHVHNIEPGMDFCVRAASGDYCLGFYTITHYGYMEHITGVLKEPLVAGKVYKVSFALRFYGDKPFFSKGLGYKFSEDSVVFKSKVIFEKKLSPFYPDLFQKHKIFSDFEFNEYLTDSIWNRYSTYYTAKGGEKFITFGQFAFQDDKLVIKQIESMRRNPLAQKMLDFMEGRRCVFIEKIDSVKITRKNELSANYYLLDDVNIEEVKDERLMLQHKTCEGCIDSEPATLRIPDRRIVNIDKGFYGDLTLEINATLKPMEKIVIAFGKHQKVIIVNNDSTGSLERSVFYSFRYPARKINKQQIIYFIEKTNADEIAVFERIYKKNVYENGSFSGLLFQKK
jgi:hypothetical protein